MFSLTPGWLVLSLRISRAIVNLFRKPTDCTTVMAGQRKVSWNHKCTTTAIKISLALGFWQFNNFALSLTEGHKQTHAHGQLLSIIVNFPAAITVNPAPWIQSCLWFENDLFIFVVEGHKLPLKWKMLITIFIILKRIFSCGVLINLKLQVLDRASADSLIQLKGRRSICLTKLRRNKVCPCTFLIVIAKTA